jgi:hypothetical protein
MPMLDAKALKKDAKGLAFLRAVLGLRRPKRAPSWLNRAFRSQKPEPAALPPPREPLSR